MSIKITEVQIVPIKPQDGLVGFVSFVFNNSLYCGSIGIYTRPLGGYRLAYPTRKGANKSFNIFNPINKKVAEEIQEVIISKFEEVIKSYVRYSQINTR